MCETGRTAQVVEETERYNIGKVGVSEIRWSDSGILTTNSRGNRRLIRTHRRSTKEGVGITSDKKTKMSLLGWELVKAWIIRPRFFSK